MRILARIDAIDAREGAHDACRPGTGHRSLEWRKIDLPHRLFADHIVTGRVHAGWRIANTASFLGINREMLHRGHHMMGLNGLHFAGRHFRDQKGILTKGLRHAAGLPAARDIKGRAENDAETGHTKLLADQIAIAGGRVAIEARRDGNG